MKMICGVRALSRGLAMLPLAVLLASCGESDNFSPDDVGTVASCKKIPGASCVNGRLIDDAAENVNYECGIEGQGRVNSVTGFDGLFVCPNGSTVTFSLINPEKRSVKLVLGSVKVKRPADIYTPTETTSGQSEDFPVYFYVTPRDLANDPNREFSNGTLNIARLLHTLSTDPIDPALPSYRVVISDEAKTKLTAENIKDVSFSAPYEIDDPANPEPGTFDAQIQGFLQSFTPAKSLISVSEASSRVSRGIFSTLAGVYESYDLTALAFTESGGMIGTGNGYFVGAMWNLVDRKGRALSSGVYSYTSDPATVLWKDPKAFTLDNATWPVDGNLSGLVYSLRNASGAPDGRKLEMTQGDIRREAVAGSTLIYRSLFNESPDSQIDLGRWTLRQGSTTLISEGKLTMVRLAPVASVLDPDLWNTDNLDFPLPVTVTVRNNNIEDCAPYGCEIGTFRMVVLSDGNIITDENEKCGVGINQNTLTYGSGGSEQSIGVVARILGDARDEGNSTMETMTLLVMLPDIPYFRNISPYLPYLQFGSNFTETSLLRVDGGANELRLYGECTADRVDDGQCTTAGAYAPDVAPWGNRYTGILATGKDVTDPLSVNADGLLSSERTAAAACVP